MKIIAGKRYEVKEWFANKVANEVKRNITMCDVFAVLKETDKAIYAMLNIGCDLCKTMWIPKSSIIASENAPKVIIDDDYNKCLKLFREFWENYK